MFLARENYKDDYFNNLSFIKAMSNEQGNIPVMQRNNIPNKDLLRVMMKDNSYPSYNGTKTTLEIKNILLEMREFLNEIKPDVGLDAEEDKTRMLNSFLQQNKADFRPLSTVQINASLKMQTFLLEREYNNALRELANCIEDDGKGLNNKKWISINEYALYANLVNGFLNHLLQEEDWMREEDI